MQFLIKALCDYFAVEVELEGILMLLWRDSTWKICWNWKAYWYLWEKKDLLELEGILSCLTAICSNGEHKNRFVGTGRMSSEMAHCALKWDDFALKFSNKTKYAAWNRWTGGYTHAFTSRRVCLCLCSIITVCLWTSWAKSQVHAQQAQQQLQHTIRSGRKELATGKSHSG